MAGLVEGAARLQGSDRLEVICECRQEGVCLHQAIASELVYEREEWFRGPEILTTVSPGPWGILFLDPSGEAVWNIERWSGHEFDVYEGGSQTRVVYLRGQWTCLGCARSIHRLVPTITVLRCVHTEILAHGPLPEGRITAVPDEP